MSDQKLDLLYGLCFSQMIRSKLSPTYVEKRILNETVNCVKTYILEYVDTLKKKIQEDKKRCMESYLTWDTEYYKKDSENKEKLVFELEKKIKETSPEDFLNIDFSSAGDVLDTAYPNSLPVSLSRETLWTQWYKIKEKHD